MTMNSVVIVGRVGQDPELRYFESGSVKASFSIAVDRNFSKTNRITDWFNIEVWGRQAEFVGEWVKKGAWVAVNGQLELQRWNDQAGGVREKAMIKAQDVRFVGNKGSNSGGGGSSYGNAGQSSDYNAGYNSNQNAEVVPF